MSQAETERIKQSPAIDEIDNDLDARICDYSIGQAYVLASLAEGACSLIHCSANGESDQALVSAKALLCLLQDAARKLAYVVDTRDLPREKLL